MLFPVLKGTVKTRHRPRTRLWQAHSIHQRPLLLPLNDPTYSTSLLSYFSHVCSQEIQ